MSKVRITLVKPPERSDMNFGTFSLAVLAAAVRDLADITILDSTFLEVGKAVEKTLETQPDLVGVTTMGLASVAPSTLFVKVLRDGGFSRKVIVGGHGATMTPRPLLEAGADAVVLGEGEDTFRELLQEGIAPAVKGLALLREGEVKKTPPRPLIRPLDLLGEPARDLAGPPPEGAYLIETSRGCPHGCIFCETTRFYQKVWRPRSPEVVARDIQKLVENGATIIHVVDDNFTADPKRALQICELLEGGPLPLFFFFSARSDDLLRVPALVPALARAHFLRAGIGIETLEPELAHYIHKPITFEQHERACQLLRESGIYTLASFIMGLPGETEEMRKRSVDLTVKVGVDAAYFVPFQPLPGTPLEREGGQPESWAVEAAAEANEQFRRHPVVVERLLEASRETTVHGLLARTSLVTKVKEGILAPQDAERVKRELKKIDPGLF